MSRIRLYIDEDAAEKAVVDGLRRSGIDVLTSAEAGRNEFDDEEQLEYAAELHRAIYSLNAADFCRLHGDFLAAGRNHAGIVVIPRQRYDVGEKIRQLLLLVETVSAEEMANRLEFL